MTYKIVETVEAGRNVENFAMYMMEAFKSKKAAFDFLKDYDKSVESLKTFPFGYRGVSFEYRRYEIRLKPFKSYNIFFTVDIEKEWIIILRVLKDRQDWQTILFQNTDYHL